MQYYAEFTSCKIGKVHPCTGTEALYRPYGPVEALLYPCMSTALEGGAWSASRTDRSNCGDKIK